MKKSIPMFLAAATAMTLAANANASIVLQTIVDDSMIDPLLVANGWTGILLRLHATDPGELITAVDMKNDTGAGTPGITGPIHQTWTIATNTGNPRVATPTDDPANYPTGQGLATDSFFNSTIPWLSQPDPSTEDNNLQNTASNPPYNASPETDLPVVTVGKSKFPGSDYGVGSKMTESGAIALSAATSDLDLAFVIVPKNAQGDALLNVKLKANALDQSSGAFQIDQTINGPSGPVPEPASVGLLGLGVLGMVARRRKA